MPVEPTNNRNLVRARGQPALSSVLLPSNWPFWGDSTRVRLQRAFCCILQSPGGRAQKKGVHGRSSSSVTPPLPPPSQQVGVETGVGQSKALNPACPTAWTSRRAHQGPKAIPVARYFWQVFDPAGPFTPPPPFGKLPRILPRFSQEPVPWR